MPSYLDLYDDETLQSRIDEKNGGLFEACPGRPELQLNCLSSSPSRSDVPSYALGHAIQDVQELQDLSNNEGPLQVYTIRHQNTWSTLDISETLFKGLLERYDVFQDFWGCVLAYGVKCVENEFDFPGCRFQSTPTSNGSNIFESCCVLRRAERNNRTLTKGQFPWSIRQTAVYHRRIPIERLGDERNIGYRSVFIIISPSEAFEKQMERLSTDKIDPQYAMSWQNIFRILVSDSMKGWQGYLAWMEREIKDHSNRLVFATIGPETTNLSVDFADRQALKRLEDRVTEVRIILQTKQDTLQQISQITRKISRHESCVDDAALNAIIERLDEYVTSGNTNQQRGEALQWRVDSVTKLLSDLLSYEDAFTLKDIGREAQAESKAMHELTEKSSKDASAVKTLTIISLVYLPITVVTNFFSSEFVHTTDTGNMQVSRSTWLLAVISLPLTLLTIACWWYWVYMRLGNLPVSPKLSLTGSSTLKVRLQDRLRSPFFRTRRSIAPDLERGSDNGPPEGCVPSPASRSYQMPGRGWSMETGSTKIG
ncbi:hypothetical protein K491DRAFT_760648 [Lophiostoma macrostomum CBS 122681]|uniref:CorA-like transporter domain-containing protein n=1 Tax=Lophiostoma macrostomum CBS 122681 TaxID=1314788 RepID=A0A6A6SZS0_9PLEO|nr:hypothetical protein K491DRAFT_760648 [Lophiostoma macrostomum CBS 122681]